MPLFKGVECESPKMLLNIMGHFRQCQTMQLDMLRSHSFAPEKASKRIGIAGERIMHAYCAARMAWRSGSHRRALLIIRLRFAHGGLARRLRENAALALLATMLECERAGR
eukprot:1778548-Pyramimonas_sp.AAC.1